MATLRWDAGDAAAGGWPEIQQWYGATRGWGDLFDNAQPDPITVRHERLDTVIHGLSPGAAYSYRVRFVESYDGSGSDASEWAYVDAAIPEIALSAETTPAP